MAILQISRIQVRRGLQQDLPQLASGEFGWSMDQRRLFIGNGTIDEGAPTQGRTEIVTAPSLTSIGTDLLQYSFKGTKSGYISQTGSSVLSPVYRALQEVLDETVTVTDFGATGDGTTDDTAAINRAIQQIYVSSLLSTVPVRRVIRFPAGTYKVTSTILIPPYCTLLGSGKNNSVITSTSATVFTTADSLYQSGIGSLGTNSATLPTSIAIGHMGFTTTGGTNPAVVIDSTRDILFKSVYFSAASGATNAVTITNSATTASTGVTFENCTFNGAATGLGATTISGFAGVGVRVKDSIFTNNSTAGIVIGSVLSGLVSENNYFDTTVTAGITGITGNNYSFGDTYASGDNAGIYSGSAKTGTGRSVALTGSNVVATLTTGAGSITYQINDSSNNYRYGTLKYNRTATVLSFDDEYTEPATALSANLWAHANGSVICTTTGSYTLKYNITQFV